MKKRVVLLAVVLTMALTMASSFTAKAAFVNQGMVTGRIYDEIAGGSSGFFQEMYDMKIGWVRIEFEEFYFNPGYYAYNSPEVQARKAVFQTVINKAHQYGIKVLGVIGASAMPYDPDFPNTDASINAYKDCVQWHLDNYAVDAVEIWNEPGGYMFTNDNLQQYAKTLIAVYGLKASYPNVTFVGPASVNAERGTWLGYHGSGYNPENSIFNCTPMLIYRTANNGKLPLDVISWHPYGTGGDPYGNFYYGRSFDTYYNEILAYADRTGRNVIGSYPIWFTEYGWDSSLVGEENQRIYTERMVMKIYSKAKVQLPFLYCYRDDGNSTGTEGKSYGIRTSLEAGSTPKRVYYPFVAHSCIVGLFSSDGVNEWTVDQIVSTYMAQGGLNAIGSAYRHPDAPWYGDKAHYWGPNNNGIIQQFNYGALGECAIAVKVNAPEAFLVKGAFYWNWANNNGPYNYGWPTTNEYHSGGYVYQNYDNGRMRIDGSGNFAWLPY